MSVRRSLVYAGLTFSLAALAFSLGSWISAARHGAAARRQRRAPDGAARRHGAQHPRDRGRRSAAPSGTDGQRQPEVVPAAGDRAERARRRDQAAASERDGAVAGAPPARAPRELRRAERVSTTSARPATARPATSATATSSPSSTASIALDEPSTGARRAASRRSRFATRARTCPPASSIPATRTSRCIRATGRSSGCASKIDLPPLRIDTALQLRLRRADLPPRQRLLEGHHPQHRLRRPADAERARDLPDRRASRRVGRRRAEPGAATWSGIPIGRMQGDYRFSFILPVRAEMFRKVPGLTQRRRVGDRRDAG